MMNVRGHIIILASLTIIMTAISPGWSQTNCIPCDRQTTAGLIPETTGQPGDFALRRAGQDVEAKWKISVGQDGWYRLTHAQLIASGMPSNQLIGSQLRMYSRTQEVAILVTSSNLLTAQDAIYFYGIKHDGVYSRTNAYWLGIGGEGRRMNAVSGLPIGGESLVTSVCFSTTYDPKILYRPFHQPLVTSIDHWFAELVNTSTLTSISMNTTNRTLGEVANIRISMFGLTQDAGVNPDHRTRIRVNNTVIAQPTYDDTTLYITNYYINSSNLVSGLSVVDLIQNQLGVANDLAYLISLRIDYVAMNIMRTFSQEFCGRSGTNRYRVSGVTTNGGIWVLNIADPYAPVLIENPLITNSTTIEFRYATNAVTRFAVIQSNGVINAATLEQVDFRNLGDTGRGADYLLICPYQLRQQAYRLAKHRYTNGLSVAVAPLPDVYNEFGYGVIDADAIRQFVGYAYHHWSSPVPRFAVLVGEGTYDPLGFIGSIPSIQVPVKFGPTPFVVAAHDAWYGLVDGDDLLPDVIIGRMSLSTTSQMSNSINKIISFDTAAITANALVVADNNDGTNNFVGSLDTYIYTNLFTNGFSISRVVPPLTTARITISNNFGRRIVAYVGHGAVDRWSSVNIWNTNDVMTLANTVYPLVTIFSCQNGSFIDRITNCLSETMIEAPRAASSVFCPTALSVQQYADYMAAGFMQSMLVTKRRHLGDVAFNAYLNLWANGNPNVAELRTYQILGDPGLLVNRPGTLP